LRTLLVTGSRGSARFHARLGNYQRFLISLTHLFQAFLELQRRRADEAPLLALVQAELNRVLEAVDADLGILSKVALHSHALPPTDLNAAFAALETRVRELRNDGRFRRAALEGGEAFFGHFSALRLIRDELNLMREMSGELPRVWVQPPSKQRRRLILPAIDGFWALAGVKAGLSVCLAFLLLKWTNPPGPNGIPLAAFTVSVFGRPSINTGGTGDLRSFQKLFLTFLLGLPIVALLWPVMPVLSNYWAMNTFLFIICYAFGFAGARVQGISFGMLIGILSITTFVALNPQEPVSFTSLMDSYLGLMTGIGLGTLVGRLFWPVLPQALLRRNLMLFFKDLRRLLTGCKDEEFILTGTVLLPLEALRAVENMILPHCSTQERGALADFIRVAQPLGMQITCLRKVRAKPLPPGTEDLLAKPFAELDAAFDLFLAKLSARFRNPAQKLEFPDLAAAFGSIQAAIRRVREQGILATADLSTVADMLELADRYHTIVEHLESCRDRVTSLRLEHYLGDFAL
jgi:uncharacterized membrane protein YccC